MKVTKTKRLIYTNTTGYTYIGAEEYDVHLTDDNILGTIHTLGKTMWIDNQLWSLKENIPNLRINVEVFYHYEKSWYDKLIDYIRLN